jgi:hypothetical protein
MAERSEFTVDTRRGYAIAGRAPAGHDYGPALLDIVLSRADGQPFQDGRTEFSVPLPVDDDLT